MGVGDRVQGGVAMDDIWTPNDDEQLTVEETEVATQDTITKFAKLNCCMTLDMHNPHKSKGSVFEWRGRRWISVGGTSQYLHWYEVELREVVEAHLYDGPTVEKGVCGPDYYVGGYFRCKGKEYRILPYELNLVREDRARYEQKSLFLEVKHEA